MLVLLIITRMYIGSHSASHSEQEIPLTKVVITNEELKDNAADELFNSLSFAKEELPLEDKKVTVRMKRTLKAHNYNNLQTNKLHQKASKWFPIIEPILKKYNIPDDFKYMPLVESGLHSGTSHKGASGYWQFMPQTARSFGLRVDGTVDERQHVRKSTIAACKYLRSLFGKFKSWTLVAAAYNAGEGGLKRQMARQDKDDYFKMKLNRETATYVYKLISMKEIIENPKQYGYKSKPRRLLAHHKAENVKRFSPKAERKAMMAMQMLQN